MSGPPLNSFRLMLRVFGDARVLWKRLIGIFFLGLISANMKLLTPIPISFTVDYIINRKPLPGFLTAWRPFDFHPGGAQLLICASVLAGLIILFDAGLGYAAWIFQLYVGEALVLRFRSKLFLKLQKLSIVEHDRKGVADLLYRLQYDVPPMQYLALHGLIPALSSLVMFVVILILVSYIDRAMAIIAICTIPLIWLAARAHLNRSRHGWATFKTNEKSGLTALQEVLGNIRVVKSFQQEFREQRRFEDLSWAALKQQLKVVRIEAQMGILTTLLIALGVSFSLAVGVLHVESGQLTTGQLILVISYMYQLFQPLEALAKNFSTMQSGLASAERAFEIFDNVPQVADISSPVPLRSPVESIKFDNLSFSYHPDKPILENVSFEIRRGMCVGISGRTGLGKTTLINLLMRFIDPTSGSIQFDGIDIRDFRITDLRGQFSFVQQESVLFSSTIAENIAYGRPEASMTEIRAAAEAAEADAFISNLKDGYATVLGERGMTLSGGERQRISLARAYLKNAPLLVLDEPTSGLDVQTESGLIQTLRRSRENQTTIIVSHRPAVIEHADLRLHLENNRITTLLASSLSPNP